MGEILAPLIMCRNRPLKSMQLLLFPFFFFRASSNNMTADQKLYLTYSLMVTIHINEAMDLVMLYWVLKYIIKILTHYTQNYIYKS